MSRLHSLITVKTHLGDPLLACLMNRQVWLSRAVLSMANVPEEKRKRLQADDTLSVYDERTSRREPLIAVAALSELFWFSNTPEKAEALLRHIHGVIVPRMYELCLREPSYPWESTETMMEAGRFMVVNDPIGGTRVNPVARDACIISRSDSSAVTTFLEEFLDNQLLDDAITSLIRRQLQKRDAQGKSTDRKLRLVNA